MAATCARSVDYSAGERSCFRFCNRASIASGTAERRGLGITMTSGYGSFRVISTPNALIYYDQRNGREGYEMGGTLTAAGQNTSVTRPAEEISVASSEGPLA